MSTEQQLNEQTKLAMWAGRISECRNSGLTVKRWCKENGVGEQTYYKWQKRVFALAKAQHETQLVIYKRRFNSLRFSFMMKEVGLTEFPIGTPRPTTNVSAILHHSAFDLAGWDRMLLPFNAPI